MIRLKECIFQWGGGTINGDLHITGNLIIGDSDVAEDNQVTSDLIQDLYNKVYQPTQTIYVDAVNGNDNNDGSWSKPLKTIDKASDLFKENVPIITISIIDNTGTVDHYINKVIRPKNGNEELRIYANHWEENVVNKKRIRIHVNLNNYYLNYIDKGKTYNMYGPIIAADWQRIEIRALHIFNIDGISECSIPYDYSSSKLNRQLFIFKESLNITYSQIDLKYNSLCCPDRFCSITNQYSTINQSTDFYIIDAHLQRWIEEDSKVQVIADTFGYLTGIVCFDAGHFTGHTNRMLADNVHCLWQRL